jgi:hypothetical protein
MSEQRRRRGGVLPTTTLAVAALGATTTLAPACAPRLSRPEAAIDQWTDAVARGQWDAAYDLLAPEARGGLTREEFGEWCDANAERLRAQADRVRTARTVSEADVRAWLPLDAARDAELVWLDGRWFLARDLPLAEGGDSPQESLAGLSALLRSEAMQDVLAILSGRTRQRFVDELTAIADALAQGAAADVSIYGDTASVAVGDLTLRLRREAGVWKLESVQQPYSYDYYGY